MSFKKDYIYILYSEDRKHWYIVRQVGQKSWIAMNFTNINISQYDISMKHNGVELWKILNPRSDYKKFTTNQTLRKGMFQILQFGHF